MSKKNKQDDLLKVFLVGEVYKAFNKHPNKTFNYKQLIRLIKSELPVFVEQKADFNFYDFLFGASVQDNSPQNFEFWVVF